MNDVAHIVLTRRRDGGWVAVAMDKGYNEIARGVANTRFAAYIDLLTVLR